MALRLDRREFSTLLAGTVLALGALPVRAAPLLAAPEIDRLSIRVVVDSGHELFLDKTDHPMVKIERSGIGVTGGAKSLAGLNSQWGLSLYIESSAGPVTRRQLLDFGLTPEVMINNAKLSGVDPTMLDGLILSHGHGDHFGGLIGFIDAHRARLRPDLALVVGGEDNFCWQHIKTADGRLADYGVLDRRDLERLHVGWSVAETPRLILDQSVSTGRIARESIEKVLPNTLVEYGQHGGAGCDAGHFTAAERGGDIVPNQHWNEHATCFNLRGRGLVVISSCGHAGIINSVRMAQQVTGIAKVHAIIGGFHLYPASASYVADIVQGLKALDPDLVIPMHCSGVNFVMAAHEIMPEALVTSATGNRFTLGG